MGEAGFVGTLPQPRRDFSGVGYDEAMRRARAIVPALRERAQACEDARMLIRENEQLLHETGLFRFHQPKAFGGMELDFVAIFDIPAEIARGCPSTAWNVGNLGNASLDARLLGARDPARGVGCEPGCADRLVDRARGGPRAQSRRRVRRQRPLAVLLRRRQCRLEHARRHCLRRRQGGRLAALPGAEDRLRDHRHLVRDGHGGTGSKDIAARTVRAGRRALALQRTPRRIRHPGAAINRGALFGIPIIGAAGIPLSPASIGAARAPTSISSRRCRSAWAPIRAPRSRTSRRCRSSSRARACLINSGRALSRNASIALQDMSARGEIPDLATNLRFRAQLAFAVNQAREAVETLWSCYGAQGLTRAIRCSAICAT